MLILLQIKQDIPILLKKKKWNQRHLNKMEDEFLTNNLVVYIVKSFNLDLILDNFISLKKLETY
jgi:hypothetical protein